MRKDFVFYHVYGRLETKTFEREQITRDGVRYYFIR